MGEAIYYLIARFATAEQAQETLPKVEAFLEELWRCQELWYKVRGQKYLKAADRKIRQAFPNVFERLNIAEPKKGTDLMHLNYLAGVLDAPDVSENGDGEVWCNGDSIGFHGEVWHMADWNHLAKAMKAFGAKQVEWLSDEAFDPYDALDSIMQTGFLPRR